MPTMAVATLYDLYKTLKPNHANAAEGAFAPSTTNWDESAVSAVGVDEQNVLAQAEVEFELKEMEGHATNVHYFGGVQFQQFGLHHVEIYLQEELRLRFPLPVIHIQRK